MLLCLTMAHRKKMADNGVRRKWRHHLVHIITFLPFKGFINFFYPLHHFLPFSAKQLLDSSLYIQVCRVDSSWLLMF